MDTHNQKNILLLREKQERKGEKWTQPQGKGAKKEVTYYGLVQFKPTDNFKFSSNQTNK